MSKDSEKVIEHLVEKWGEDKECPMCGNTSWIVNEEIYEVPRFSEKAETNEVVFPVVPVSCTNCYSTQFISAVMIGLVEGDPDE